MKTKIIQQTVTFDVLANVVYEALVDTRKHSRFTRSRCSISRVVGRKFSAYDGYIEGVNLDLVPDKKIEQSWRGSDWPEGHYSRVTFLLEEEKNKTNLTFTQTAVPEEFFDDISQGWYDNYWEPMKEMFKKMRRKKSIGLEKS
ncbi:MAG: SRPBCC family protein [Dehalococcoidia bacterium]|nr:SRPBCC family protein [Dehalococcoidia bacterium]